MKPEFDGLFEENSGSLGFSLSGPDLHWEHLLCVSSLAAEDAERRGEERVERGSEPGPGSYFMKQLY